MVVEKYRTPWQVEVDEKGNAVFMFCNMLDGTWSTYSSNSCMELERIILALRHAQETIAAKGYHE